MKRPNLELHAMHAMCGICLLVETLVTLRLVDQRQYVAGVDSALLSGDSGC